MSEQVTGALRQLDAADDTHWTNTGEPSLELVRQVSGVDKLSRKQLTDIAPTLKRETFDEWLSSFDVPDAPNEDEQEQPQVAPELQGLDRKSYDELMQIADQEVADADRAVAEARRAYADAQKRRDDLIVAKEKHFPKPTPMELLKQHVAQTHQHRVEAAGGPAAIDGALGARPRAQYSARSPGGADRTE